MAIHSYKSRVIIIDPDEHVRKSLELLINSSDDFIVVHASNAIEPPSKYVELDPDVLLIDLPHSHSESVEWLRQIRALSSNLQIILYCLHEDHDLLLEAIKSGVCGYISKSSNYAELQAFLQLVISGEATMTSKLASMIMCDDVYHNGLHFTFVQQRLLNFLSRGKTYLQISEELSVPKSELRRQIKNIYQRINRFHLQRSIVHKS